MPSFKRPHWFTSPIFLVLFMGIIVAALIGIGYQYDQSGFPKDTSITKIDRKEKSKDEKGSEIEIVTTTTIQDPKKVWDWLSLLGVPLALAVFAVWLEGLQQRAAQKKEELDEAEATRKIESEKIIAEKKSQEEAFQNYIDRMLALAVDQNFIAACNKVGTSEDEGKLVEAIAAVVQARTESILRTVYGNGKLQIQVLRFITDAKVFRNLDFQLRKPDLSNANFMGANFDDVILIDANLSGANLSNASFFGAYLPGANLSGANLKGAWLAKANLSGADLSAAKFPGADLSSTNLSKANLSGADLSGANLSEANLRGAKLFETNLSCADFSCTDLSHAELKIQDHLKLFGSEFEGANLKGTHISNEIVKSINLTPEQQAQLICIRGNLWVKEKREDWDSI